MGDDGGVQGAAIVLLDQSDTFMPTVTFLSPDGEARAIEAEPGEILLHLALANAIEGIIGECGGALACGTCHVYVDERFSHLLPPAHPEERALVDFASEPKPTSRLCCQISMAPELDGLVLAIAKSQP